MTPSKFHAIRRAAALLACTAGLCASGASHAQAILVNPSDSRLYHLDPLYGDIAIADIWNFCTQRVPETAPAWNQTIGDWQSANSAAIHELHQLQEQIVLAMRAHSGPIDLDAWNAILSARVAISADVMTMIAPMNDAQAKKYCEEFQASFAKDVISEADMKDARARAAGVLAYLNGH